MDAGGGRRAQRAAAPASHALEPLASGDRTAKAALTAVVATAGTLVAHVAGGAAAPGLIVVAAAVALAVLVALPLSGRAVSPLRLTGVVIASQALFHLFFLLAEPTGAALVLVPAPGHEGHAVVALAGEISHGLHVTPPMVAAHAIAGALTLLALHCGERIVERLAEAARSAWRGLRVLVGIVGDLPTPAPATRIAHAWASPAKPDELLRAWPGTRRGPPLPAVA
ncbi:hypothetical protein GCM10011490_01270 [Pseudoclavibacter endophyticus]|uniref:Uncharacterized protein n=1 Tax=Pseudoclavibacter endophyticus TaxID=1778590 RepID=A0A6H9WH80_9MICO|nr:hypothetical protein [Pseudoclavibacter endophyticus]KAB1650319.1 hypothetical protein F8O04_09070 [Pseudoclavibacter endophyticus]GGA55178.1 hypothetical protein GCM10011490_01270 [Pseudoclavibacter endophyticus]